MNRWAGRYRLYPLLILFPVFYSCVLFPGEKPLNPRLLFTVGSEPLESVESAALKGSIEFEGEGRHESGSFQLIVNRGDSLAFVIEGPFKIDVFRMVMIEKTAYARDRDSDSWTVVNPDERLSIPEYGIENFTPDILGYFVFPQFYAAGDMNFDSDKLLLSSDEYSFRILPSRNVSTFTMENRQIDLTASYARRKDRGSIYYPSRIEISKPDRNWKISFEIEKIRLDPEISSKIWDRNS